MNERSRVEAPDDTDIAGLLRNVGPRPSATAVSATPAATDHPV